MVRLLALVAAVVSVTPAPAQDARKGRKVALLVAVQDYADSGLTNLKYTENDITELAKVLKAQGYRDDDVVVLSDTAAAEKKKLKYVPTADHIRNELRGLAEDLRAEDSLVVAFSGHGAHLKALKERGLHFCAKGTDLNKPETMVSLAEVYEQLDRNCKADLKLLFVDACRNDPTDGKSGGDGRLESVTRPLLPDPPGGTVAFFSCSTGQKSYESDALKHGVFFHHVIQGLKGGPADDPIARKGEVTVGLLEDYLMRAVPVAVKKDRDDRTARQVPERLGKLRGRAVLARGLIRWPGEDEYRQGYRRHYAVGGPSDRKAAVGHFRRAADAGHPLAKVELAGYLRGGQFVDRDERAAERLERSALAEVREAAEQDLAAAQTWLGRMYATGRGVASDQVEAVRWFKKAADQNYAPAQFNLAVMYADGQGVDKDEAEAVRWYRKAADQGDADAQNNLGVMYETGRGVAKDEAEAVRWFRKAADQGHENAKRALERLKK